MDSLLISISETFEFMQPFCSVALRKQAAFESAPLVRSMEEIPTTCATEETDWTQQQGEDELLQRCDTSLTSTISEDAMLVYNRALNPDERLLPASPVPSTVTFFTPHHQTQLNRLHLKWQVKRSVGGVRGIDEWTGRLGEDADARQDTAEQDTLGHIACLRISPALELPVTETERLHQLEALHPQLPALVQQMSHECQYYYRISNSKEPARFSLPLVMVTDVQIAAEHRGNGLGLLLVDEACRCLANPAQWVVMATAETGLSDYFGILGFRRSEQNKVLVRWNDPYCMATHRYEDVCPHLPRVTIR